MKPCVYAIFSHINPGQVIRLVRTLRALSPYTYIVVHHDPSYITLSSTTVKAAGGIMVPNPVQAEWGDFSLVSQHLHTMRWCTKNLDFESYITLTGQTYPIKPRRDFETYLSASQYDTCLIYFNAYDPTVWPQGEAARRYHSSYMKVSRFKYWHRVPKAILSR